MTCGRLVITGGAGLVGLNLATLVLQESPELSVTVIDKHRRNVEVLHTLHPEIEVVEADLAVPGQWQEKLSEATYVVVAHAQIGGTDESTFERNNVTATERVLEAMGPDAYLVHLSSSVLNSRFQDDYSRSKRQQESVVRNSGLVHCILRPTLMFGWFDRKHLGFLSRFMARSPVFPIPGSGRWTRQPLYARDFCRLVLSALERRITGEYNITGLERIEYIELIRTIRKLTGSRTLLLPLPLGLFAILLRIYALFDSDPPFTVHQLRSLTTPDDFEVIDWPRLFDVVPTPIAQALAETFLHPRFSKFELEF